MLTETPEPAQHSNQLAKHQTSDHGLANLSLSSKTVHADDFLNNGQDVAPALHVSTTYRYNKNPDKLTTWAEHDVSLYLDVEGIS
jgi:hypothetical protein